MGDSLDPAVWHAFVCELTKAAAKNELEKQALAPSAVAGWLKGLGTGAATSSLGRIGRGARLMASKQVRGPGGLKELGWRLSHPIKGTVKGFKEMSPRFREKELTGVQAALQKLGPNAAKKKWFGAGSAGHLLRHQRVPVSLRSITTGKAPGMPTSRIQGMAEELSRRGWTGGGRVTKYLPMGGKAMTTGFTGMAVPDIIRAARERPTRTGEGGFLERGLGEAAGTLGFVGGAGLGAVPGMGLWYGLHRGGSALGRVFDRMRAGADVKSAVDAPSPTEAAAQQENIKRYYGGTR